MDVILANLVIYGPVPRTAVVTSEVHICLNVE